MKLIDNIANKAYLGVSRIPGAGIGVFTGTDIPAGIPVVEYKGDVFDSIEELKPRYQYTLTEGITSYAFIYVLRHKHTGEYIDCHPALGDNEIGLGAFVNDTRTWAGREKDDEMYEDLDRKNSQSPQYLIDLGYNTYFWYLPKEPKAYLMSMRGIKAGEELYVDYGAEYWKPLQQRQEASLKAAELVEEASKNTEENTEEVSKNTEENTEEANVKSYEQV